MIKKLNIFALTVKDTGIPRYRDTLILLMEVGHRVRLRNTRSGIGRTIVHDNDFDSGVSLCHHTGEGLGKIAGRVVTSNHH